MQLVDALLHELKLLQVQHIYGIPGDFVLPLFEQLQQRNQLPLVYLSHEPAAVFAADAAARISNNPSAVILTYGAGALNAVNAVAQAFVEHVPMLVIAGYPAKAEKDRQLLIHHQARRFDSQKKIFEEITACQVRLDDPTTAWKQLLHACTVCKEESLPVLIEWPRNASNFEVGERPAVSKRIADTEQLELAVTRLQQALSQAKRPELLVDVDVRRSAAVEETEQLANCGQLGHWHYAELAEAMGAIGLVANDSGTLVDAIRLALKQKDKPVLIEVRYPAGQQSLQLRRFAQRFLGTAN